VGRLKAEHALPPSDPAREARQIERLQRLAVEADLDPEFARKFLNFIISEVIRHHEKLPEIVGWAILPRLRKPSKGETPWL
jgi:chorismate mutase